MIIEEEFDIAAPLDRVWPVLKDIPRVASCIPNATITEIVDEKTFRANVAVKVGPVSVSYNATILVERLDDGAHEAQFEVKGDEMRGRGGVRATVRSKAVARHGVTHVTLSTDAQISGVVATVGGRLIEGVAKKTTATFAQNLSALV